MEAFTKKNFIMTLAGILVVALGIMAFSLSQNRNKTSETSFNNEINEIKTQSTSSNINDIEKDLKNTDFSDSEKELQNIEAEINKLK